jgi:hypothetical protein
LDGNRPRYLARDTELANMNLAQARVRLLVTNNCGRTSRTKPPGLSILQLQRASLVSVAVRKSPQVAKLKSPLVAS